MLIDAVTRSQAALHDMLMAIPVLRRNIEHSNAQHDQIVGAILGGERGTSPGGHGGALRRHLRAAAWPHRLRRQEGTTWRPHPR